jgi:hypothetical protein
MSIFTRAFNKFGGTMRYEGCTTLIVAQSGLYVPARPPAQGVQAAIFGPWSEIRAA